MRIIPLTQDKVTVVSDRDYKWLSKFKWRVHKDSKNGRCYAARSARRADGRVVVILMHQEIKKPKPGTEVDHRDNDGLNNGRHNLRNCTHKQNNMNQGVNNVAKKSMYKGVSPNDKKWMARILGSVYLGTVASEIEAAKLYDKAAKKLFGRYAHLNFTRK